MQNLNIAHSAFKNAYFMSGNVCSPFQYSVMIRSFIREGSYTHNPTLEQLVDFDLKNIKSEISNSMYKYVRENALKGISQPVYILWSPKVRDSFGKKKRYAVVVLNNDGTHMRTDYLVHSQKAYTAVDQIVESISTKKKVQFAEFKAKGRERQLLS